LKDIIIENHWFFKVWFMKNYSAMAVTKNIIICKDGITKYLIKHEKYGHQFQMIIVGGTVRFWLLYLLFYMIGLVRYSPTLFTSGLGAWHRKAYRLSIFEVKAREVARNA